MASRLHDSRFAKCSGCSAALAHDQRYCVHCGARRWPLPQAVRAHLEAIRAGRVALGQPLASAEPRAAAGAAVAATTGTAAAAGASRPPLWPARWSMPRPQAAAVAVMALLAFGVVVGWAVRPAPTRPGMLLADTPPAAGAAQPAAATPPPPQSTPEAAGETATAEAPTASPPTGTSQKAASSAPTKSPAPSEGAAPHPAGALPAIEHVFVIVLSEHGYSEAFAPGSPATYLAGTLASKGEVLSNYYAVAPGSLANEIALISGQGPTSATAEDCPTFAPIAQSTVSSDEQVVGSGCVYPAQTLTVANELTTAGKTWKAYVEGIGSGGPGAAATCRHPALGAADSDHEATPTDPYVTWRNPFVYFQSLTGGSSCAQDDVDIAQLASDLKSAATTPSVAYVIPGRCHDGSEQPCHPGAPAGLTAADSLLETLVPEIQGSPAYKQGGLIAITFDQAPQSGAHADQSACCETPKYPNLPTSGTTGASGASGATGTTGAASLGGGQVEPSGGGGRVGMLLLSPFVKAGSVNELGYYNHFSLLRSIEELFGLKRLGYTANPALPAFDKLVYNARKPKAP
jgi:phosphatidylinositol-3-phosphatase